jgi:hypothetical protein
MSQYLGLGKPIPQWAQKAFLEACYYQPKCWDDVFGRPTGKGVQRKKEDEAYFEASELTLAAFQRGLSIKEIDQTINSALKGGRQ